MSILNRIKNQFSFEDNDFLIRKEEILEVNKKVKYSHSIVFVISFIISIVNLPLGFLFCYLTFILIQSYFISKYLYLSRKNYLIKYLIFILIFHIVYFLLFYILLYK